MVLGDRISIRDSTLHERLVDILARYVSRITVRSMLTTVLVERTVPLEDLDADDLVEVVEEVMVGLRLFCRAEQLPDLMIELAMFCDQETLSANGSPSRRPASLSAVRVR